VLYKVGSDRSSSASYSARLANKQGEGETMPINRRTLYRDDNLAAQTHIDSAKIFARAGELDAAIESLQAAVEAGYTATWWWTGDPDLGELTEDTRFPQLVAEPEEALVEA
jgi:hypothetical protein